MERELKRWVEWEDEQEGGYCGKANFEVGHCGNGFVSSYIVELS